MPTVVIAYDGFDDITVECDVLRSIDANVIHFPNLDSQEAREAAVKADALMVTVQPVPASLIERMERCRIISRVGVGLDAIDIPAATRCGIWVTNVTDYSTDEVSNHAIAMLMFHARQLEGFFASVCDGKWGDSSYYQPIRRLAGQTFGVVAYGSIGRATALKARGLGLRVIASDPYRHPSVLENDGVEIVDLEYLLRHSDYVSLHSPLTSETEEIINARTLSWMKPTAFLINTSRGGLIDEPALQRAVRERQIAGAALDVLTVEPPPPDHPLLNEPRIYISPHSAWYSEEAKRDLRLRGTGEVVRVLNGERPASPVNELGDS